MSDVINPEEIKDLLELILANAKGIQPRAGRRRCAAEYLFKRFVEMGTRRIPIQGEDIIKACPGADAKDARGAARSLMRDLKNALTEFFETESVGRKQRYRVTFVGDGNYLPVLRDNQTKVQPDNFVAQFWEPHKNNGRSTMVLFVEPQFFIDSNGTYFRNPNVNTAEQLTQLGFTGVLKTSYSFVPSGIVHAMLHVIEALHCNHAGQSVLPRTAVIKHFTDIPPEHENLVVLATPTSTKLVGTLDSGFPMRTTVSGVSLNGAPPLVDTAEPEGEFSVRMIKWGVLTRRSHRVKDRIVTMLAAKHGRTVEAMAQFITSSAEIPALAVQLQKQHFPRSFQALFRVEMTKTMDGPSIDAVHVELAESLDE